MPGLEGIFAGNEPVGTVEPTKPPESEQKPEEKVETAKKPEDLFAEYKTVLEAQAKQLKKLEETISAYDAERKQREADERLRYITQHEPEKEPVGEAKPQPQIGPNDFDWGNPLKSVAAEARKIAQEELARKEKADTEYRKKMEDDRAGREFYAARDRVYKKSPKLFSGIEDEIEKTIALGYRGGAMNADMVGNDETWETGALMIAKKRGDKERIKAYFESTPEIEPMKDTGTGVIPGQVKESKSKQSPVIELDEMGKEYARQRGLTDEQAAERIKYARDNSYTTAPAETIGRR